MGWVKVKGESAASFFPLVFTNGKGMATLSSWIVEEAKLRIQNLHHPHPAKIQEWTGLASLERWTRKKQTQKKVVKMNLQSKSSDILPSSGWWKDPSAQSQASLHLIELWKLLLQKTKQSILWEVSEPGLGLWDSTPREEKKQWWHGPES